VTGISDVVRLFESDYYVSSDAVRQAVRDRSSFNLIEQTSVTKVDVFPKKQEPFRDIEFARRRRVTIAGFSTWIVTAEDLIVAKLLWIRLAYSDIQMRDVRMLLQTRIDAEYTETWVHRLALDDLWAEAHR
jgi:hypothetical protein